MSDVRAETLALLLAEHRYCPCLMKPCDCKAGCGCVATGMSPADVDDLRGDRIELARMCSALSDLADEYQEIH